MGDVGGVPGGAVGGGVGEGSPPGGCVAGLTGVGCGVGVCAPAPLAAKTETVINNDSVAILVETLIEVLLK